jgi:hypothetical protein
MRSKASPKLSCRKSDADVEVKWFETVREGASYKATRRYVVACLWLLGLSSGCGCGVESDSISLGVADLCVRWMLLPVVDRYIHCTSE